MASGLAGSIRVVAAGALGATGTAAALASANAAAAASLSVTNLTIRTMMRVFAESYFSPLTHLPGMWYIGIKKGGFLCRI